MLQTLERLASRGKRLAIFPATDGTVSWLTENWDAVRSFAEVALPDDMQVVERLVEKDLLPDEGARAGLVSPRTLRPRSADDLRSGDLVPPLIVKGVRGKEFVTQFGKKLFTADSIDEAVSGWERARDEEVETIVQELVPSHEGRVFSFFGYLDRQLRPLAVVVGLKVREAPRPFGSSTVFAAQWNDRVYELGLRLLQTSGFRGFAHVEFAYDDRIDDYVLIEVNARVPTWAGIAMGKRFNIAKVAYLDLCGEPQEPIQLRNTRLWVDFVEDVKAGPPRGLRELGRFAAPYLRPRSVGAVFAIDDLRPGLGEARRVVRSSLRRLHARLAASPT
jgi:predicted ATP-grasp superfamily ATP-dependent carboligase